LENNRYVGTASAVSGTMMAPRTIAKRALPPGKYSFAKAYPAAVARAAAPTPLTTAYKIVLRNHEA